MPGFLGTKASFLSDITLISQIAILLLLLMGYRYKKARKLREHGLAMATAVLFHVVVIFLVMVPSLAKNVGALGNISSAGVIITWIHAIAGILAVIMGLFLVTAWRFTPPPYLACVKRKVFMRPLLILWVFVLILGISFYTYYYL